MSFKKIDTQDIVELKRLAGSENVLVDQEIGEEYSHDEMTEYGSATPEVLIFARNADQVSDVLKYANAKHISVTTRGAGTGLCGACVPLNGGIVLSTQKMKKIIELDTHTMTAVVEPGVLLMELAAAAENINCLYAPDPGEKSATVGGNVNTNAGGMRAIKYGVTRDYVKGMEVVLATGEILQLGGRITKNSSGYSLKDLIIGSEGTLGVITRLELKLLPKPKKMVSLLIPFNELDVCLNCVWRVMNLPDVCTTLEFMEKEVLDDAQEYLGKDFPNREYPAYLIVSYSANSNEQLQPMIDAAANLALENGAIDVFVSDTTERQALLWNARGAFLEAIKNSTSRMDECDVVVPTTKIAEFITFVKKLSVDHQVRIRSFGHAGDGNLHVYVCKDRMPDEQWEITVNACMDAMYAKAREFKGQVSGEHGIGHAKKKYLRQSIGETQIELMRQIKHTFDPNGILNPNKIID